MLLSKLMSFEDIKNSRSSHLLVLWLICSLPTYSLCKVIWAVNCGGGDHIDLDGIRYAADALDEGIASDYGRSFTINRVPTHDQIIYQTERYSVGDLSYTIPVTEPGNYVLTLKFSEVWFTSPMQKVFSVRLNDKIDVIRDLDIFKQVGFATALNYDIPFRIADNRLLVGDQSIEMFGDFLKVTFVKTEYDNPKVNAIVLTEGSISGVSALPPLEITSKGQITKEPEIDQKPVQQHRPPAVPKAINPYGSTDYSYLIIPTLLSTAAIVPIIFYLCRL